jgi:pimeloyl-CoA dehydrogenase small subunit
MDFDLNDEQRLLQESIARLCADRYGFEQRISYGKGEEGWSRTMWRSYAELGLLGLPFPEAYGGYDGGPVETMIVMEAFGRVLALEPYFATVILGGGFLRHGGSKAQCDALIPAITQGELTLAFAYAERRARYAMNDVATSARYEDGQWVLNGAKSVVLHGGTADRLIVTARISGTQRAHAGIGLFLVDGDAAGVTRRNYATQDDQRAAEVDLVNVRVGADAVMGEPGKAWPLIERVVDEALAALCAEAVGAMSATLDLTVEYLKTRTQFGKPIGSLQALQHRAAEMLVGIEQSRSMAMLASMMAGEEDRELRHKTALAAKVQIGRAARFVGEQATQLHGGIGMTMEYQSGHYFKRLTMIDLMLGDADYHLSALAADGGLAGLL